MSERTEAPSIADPGSSPSLRLLAAERLSQLEAESASRPAVDLRNGGTAEGRDDVARELKAMAAMLGELARTTGQFHDLLTGRHLDYSEQVQRLVATTEQALTDHRATTDALVGDVKTAVSQRDDDLDRLGTAVGHISRDLAAIVEQVMAAVRESRELSDKNDAVARQLISSFNLAVRHLAEQGQVLHGEVDRLIAAQTAALPDAPDIRGEVDAAITDLREELREDLGALRKLLSRPGDGSSSADWREALDAVRTDVTAEMEAWVRDLHENQAQMMRAVIAGREEIEQLRAEVARLAEQPPAAAAAPGSQLETEIGRLLIELRAARRRPLVERAQAAAAERSERPTRTPLATRAKLPPARPVPARAPLRAPRFKRA